MLNCRRTDERLFRFSFKISINVGESFPSLSLALIMVTRRSPPFRMLPVGFRIEVVCLGEGSGELRTDTTVQGMGGILML